MQARNAKLLWLTQGEKKKVQDPSRKMNSHDEHTGQIGDRFAE
jgi:hypothetical protein